MQNRIKNTTITFFLIKVRSVDISSNRIWSIGSQLIEIASNSFFSISSIDLVRYLNVICSTYKAFCHICSNQSCLGQRLFRTKVV
jgi:hypothetical protein